MGWHIYEDDRMVREGDHMSNNFHLLVNLPPAFLTLEALNPMWDELEQIYCVRKTSHNTPEEIAEDLIWADAVFMWAWPHLSVDLLKQCPRLRFAGHINTTRASAEEELAHGLAVSDVRHAWSPAVAELALALILSGLRKLSDAHEEMRNGTEIWESRVGDPVLTQSHTVRELTSRRVGIIGFGGIGQRLADFLQPFGCDIAVYDPYIPEAVCSAYGAHLHDTVLSLAQQSDIIVVATSDNEGTKELVSKDVIQALPDYGMIVNIARANVIDMDALLERLEKRELLALLDVFEHEPLAADDSLRILPNVYCSPHIAGATVDSYLRIFTRLRDELQAFRTGKERQYALLAEHVHCLS